MKKLSLILLMAILISGCSNNSEETNEIDTNKSPSEAEESSNTVSSQQDNSKEMATEMPSTQGTSEVNEDGLKNNSTETTTEMPTTQGASEVSEDGLVKFQEGDINVNLNLNDVQTIPNFDLHIGKVSSMKLSPNKMFLYIVTAQGGGSASFIYSIEKDEVYFLGNEIRGIGEWQEDGKLKVENKQEFGESIGEVSSVYESNNADEPWKLSKK